ncbi:hypothetical protein HUE46_10975 [Flavobacterium columnare]|nr:hypothetical protein [Flavobacterium columnare]QOG90479.1 hypothetical protein HUE41_10975 [Flavobacterium columnare]QOG93135.1 hypothetical protein HUE42_10970 [Flavobacterium columnare]QOG95800.1 hypothetical protein HUE43_10970 [Flavobacterium columnare]QOG98460.1 hypothetical protein HUE44_10970 [Flavobacterium columnare]
MFLPFRDETNEVTTYGDGIYLEIRTPKTGYCLILTKCTIRIGFIIKSIHVL